MFKIEFDTGNAAFHDYEGDPEMNEYCEVVEICRILDSIKAQLVNRYATEGVCIDINGNKVGGWSR